MTWNKVKDKLPSELTHVVCYIPGIDGHLPGKDWQDSDYCIGEHIKGYWKRCDNENIKVTHWMEIPEVKDD